MLLAQFNKIHHYKYKKDEIDKNKFWTLDLQSASPNWPLS